jgi:hypothetical protein
MNTTVTRIHPAGDFTAQIEAKRAEIEGDITNAGRGFSKSMADLVQLQNAEILRLQGVLRDNTTVPTRHAVAMAVSSVVDDRGQQKHVLVATASDQSMWLMENFSPNGRREFYRWGRIPPLPQAADEADAGK